MPGCVLLYRALCSLLTAAANHGTEVLIVFAVPYSCCCHRCPTLPPLCMQEMIVLWLTGSMLRNARVTLFRAAARCHLWQRR